MALEHMRPRYEDILGYVAENAGKIIARGPRPADVSLSEEDERALGKATGFLDGALTGASSLPRKSGENGRWCLDHKALYEFALTKRVLNRLKVDCGYFEDFEEYIGDIKSVILKTEEGAEIDEEEKDKAVKFFDKVWNLEFQFVNELSRKKIR